MTHARMAEAAINASLDAYLHGAQERLAYLATDDYLSSLVGTLGADPLGPYERDAMQHLRPGAQGSRRQAN